MGGASGDAARGAAPGAAPRSGRAPARGRARQRPRHGGAETGARTFSHKHARTPARTLPHPQTRAPRPARPAPAGCADPDPAHLPRGAWCPVDPRECPSYFASFTAGTGNSSKMIYFDYCGEVRQRTSAGCLCQVRAAGRELRFVTAAAPFGDARAWRACAGVVSERGARVACLELHSFAPRHPRHSLTSSCHPRHQGEWYDNASVLHMGVCATAPHWSKR